MLGDDKRLKNLIILVLSSSSYEEDSSVSHAARCAFDPLLAHEQEAKWRLLEHCRRLWSHPVPVQAFHPTVLPPLRTVTSEVMTAAGSVGGMSLVCQKPCTGHPEIGLCRSR